jgi:hypothetical protein
MRPDTRVNGNASPGTAGIHGYGYRLRRINVVQPFELIVCPGLFYAVPAQDGIIPASARPVAC